VKIALIAAVAQNRIIGRGGSLPWHLSEDLKRFKRLTSGHTILMGRKTFESLGRPLPNRRHLVVTSRSLPGAECFPDPESALRASAGQERIFVIGGGQLYAYFLPRADEIYLTLLEGPAEGDTFFPPYEELLDRSFRLAREERHEGFRFLDYVRI
jgi:dihydrofolate reductase